LLCRDIKTITIWFQNKRQTVARSRKQQLEVEESESGGGGGGGGATTCTAAMDMLASASATMSPLAATATEKLSTAATTVKLGSGSGSGVAKSCSDNNSSLDLPPSRLQNATSCDSLPVSRVPLSATHDPNVFESVRADVSSSSSTFTFSPSTDLPKPRLGPSWPIIHPEDLWKHIPSSPTQPAFLSSPDVSPDIGTPCRSSKSSMQRPRTLEWACARSAKRRRTNPDTTHEEDEESGRVRLCGPP